MLHIRFGEPRSYELGEPIHPLIRLYRDSETNEVTALEIIDIDALLTELGRDEKREAQQHAR